MSIEMDDDYPATQEDIADLVLGNRLLRAELALLREVETKVRAYKAAIASERGRAVAWVEVGTALANLDKHREGR
jgi:hypothetical protein